MWNPLSKCSEIFAKTDASYVNHRRAPWVWWTRDHDGGEAASWTAGSRVCPLAKLRADLAMSRYV